MTPGSPAVRLGDLTKWEIRTDDLTELSVGEIREGDPVTIRFDAISGFELPGKVTGIRGYGETRRGDIIYTVTIDPDHHDERLKWNMTASVIIRPAE